MSAGDADQPCPDCYPDACPECHGTGGGYYGDRDGQGQPVPDVCPDCAGTGFA